MIDYVLIAMLLMSVLWNFRKAANPRNHLYLHKLTTHSWFITFFWCPDNVLIPLVMEILSFNLFSLTPIFPTFPVPHPQGVARTGSTGLPRKKWFLYHGNSQERKNQAHWRAQMHKHTSALPLAAATYKRRSVQMIRIVCARFDPQPEVL